MRTDRTAELPRLSPEDHRVAGLHAELHATRIALLRSLLHAPDDVNEREALWVELHRLQHAVANTLDRVRDALAALGTPPNDFSGAAYPVERADGSWTPVASHVLYPYLGECAPGDLR